MSFPLRTFCLKNLLIGMMIYIQSGMVFAADFKNYQRSGRLHSDNYQLKSFDEHTDPLFDKNPQIIDLGVNLGVGSDCGRVNFEGTMKSTLKNMLDAKYFGDVGKNIMAGSPMLLTCYMSPTWCAILKHTQLSANFLSQMRLDQCKLMDKYVDTRTEDYYRERQGCIRKNIADNGGDLEKAMASCQNVYDTDLTSWAGKSSGEKSSVNKLIESSAKWAGLSGPEADRTTDLVKAFVGDTVLAKGNVSVEYGSRQRALTPEVHLKELQNTINDKLCQGLLVQLATSNQPRSVDQVVTDDDLKSLSGGSIESLIDRQTIEALTYLPPKQRQAACKRLADTMALTSFTKDANRSLDLLTVATQNPNLPPARKTEIEEKRRQFKESVDLTLELQKERNAPLREVLREVNGQGEAYRDQYTGELLREDNSRHVSRAAHQIFMDCADSVMCDKKE